MKKNLSRILSLALVLALCLALALPAFAAGSTYETERADGSKETVTFDKYLLMKNNANVPNATFTFTVSAGSAASAETGKFEILAGPNPEKVKVNNVAKENTVTFAVGDGTSTEAGSSTVQGLVDGKKYATKQITLDFSEVVFPEPGVYRYIITESGTNQGVTNDANTARYVDVYVVDASTDSALKLKIQDIILHTAADDIATGENNGTAGTNPTGKGTGYTNEYVTYDLTFSKTVEGNQASRDKYFKFTVKIENAVKGTTYAVDLTKADSTITGNAATVYTNVANPTELVVGDDGTVTGIFYLQHGQSIKIQGLAVGTKYTVTEANEDYKSSYTQTVGEATSETNTGSIADNDVTVAYKNTRGGVIPTGILLTIAPFAVLMLIGIVGVCLMVLKKKHTN